MVCLTDTCTKFSGESGTAVLDRQIDIWATHLNRSYGLMHERT